MEGCDRHAGKRGWCTLHYQRWWKTGDPEGIRPGIWSGYVIPTCRAEECERPHHCHGWCIVHWKRLVRHGDPFAGRRPNALGTEEEKFWSFTDVPLDPDACWSWNGGLITGGYALFRLAPLNIYAHRWSYTYFVGPIPEGLHVDHTCHNADLTCPGGACTHRRCVNPAHLEPVTMQENFRRGRERKKLADL